MDDQNISYEEKQRLKALYIPLCCEGKITMLECAQLLNISPHSVLELKKRYKEKGNQAFVRANKGRKNPYKYNDEFSEKIFQIYDKEYGNKELVCENLKEFSRKLNNKYNIFVSYTSIQKLFKSRQDKSNSIATKYLRAQNLIFSDYNTIFNSLIEKIKIDSYTELEEYGIVYLCELLFDKAFLCLKKTIKLKDGTKIRTSYSLFEYISESNKISITEEWHYWNENHKFFTFIYDEKIRTKVIKDIKEVYFNMFKKIEEYLQSFQ